METKAEVASSIEVITRGVCCLDGWLLLCRNRAVGNRYLPGGHVDPGESTRLALEREILEEMGLQSEAGRFLGVCEHVFSQNGSPQAEINLIFALSIPDLLPKSRPVSREPWLAFEWFELERLDASGMEPAALRTCLPLWLAAPDALERFCPIRPKG